MASPVAWLVGWCGWGVVLQAFSYGFALVWEGSVGWRSGHVRAGGVWDGQRV